MIIATCFRPIIKSEGAMSANVLNLLIPLFLLTGLSFTLLAATRSIVRPLCIFPLSMFVFFGLPLFAVLLADDMSISPAAYWFLLVISISHTIGALAAACVSRNAVLRLSMNSPIREQSSSGNGLCRVRWWLPVSVTLILSIGYALLVLDIMRTSSAILGQPAVDSYSLSRSAALLHFQNEYTPPLVTRLSWSVLFASAFVAGFLHRNAGDAALRWLRWSSFVFAILFTLTLTAKTTLLITMLFWIAGYFCTAALSSVNERRITKELTGARVIAMLASVVVFSFVSLAWRYGLDIRSLSGDDKALLMSRFLSYISGHAVAFSAWFEERGQYIFLGDWSLARTFAGFVDAIGFVRRSAGIYTDSVSYGADLRSNVYSVWRGLIEDFGIVVTVMLVASSGFVFERCFWRARRGGVTLAYALGWYYCFIGWSFVVSVFAYNTVLLALVLAGSTILYLVKEPGRSFQERGAQAGRRVERGERGVVSAHG